jgi:pilus assembly protein CpaE
MSSPADRLQSVIDEGASGDEPPVLAAFIQDDDTRLSLGTILGSDWDATILPGGIEDAIEHLANGATPRFLVVDLSSVPEPFAALDRLAEVCAPGTLVLAIGDVNDVTFYRDLRDAGVADYLVKPVNPDALAHSIGGLRASVPAPKRPEAPAKTEASDNGLVIAVVGARGGVGASTLAATLAWRFSKTDRQNTMLVDLDLISGTAALAFDVDPGRGLADALERPERIDALLISTAATAISDHLTLLSGMEPVESETTCQAGAIQRLSSELRNLASRVVIDVPRGRIELLREALTSANVAIIVTDLSLAGLRDTTRLKTYLKAQGGECQVMVVANRVGHGGKGELSRADFEKALGGPLAALIPDDGSAVAHAVNTGRPLAVEAPASKATQAMLALGQAFQAEASAPRGLLGKLLRRNRQMAR